MGSGLRTIASRIGGGMLGFGLTAGALASPSDRGDGGSPSLVTSSAETVSVAADRVAGAIGDEVGALRDRLDRVAADIARLRAPDRARDDASAAARQTAIVAAARAAAAQVEHRTAWRQSGGRGGFDRRPFLASADDVFRLEFSGFLQWRFTASDLGAREPGVDPTEVGFEGRRIRVGLRGTVVDPRLGYRVSFGTPRTGPTLGLTDAFLTWNEGDVAWRIGRFRPAFAREERTSARRLPMIERSVAFRLGRQSRRPGASVTWTGDAVRAFAAVHDDGASSDVDADWSATARGEWRLAGTWRGVRSETGHPGDDGGLVLGAAGQWTAGRGEPRAWMATADAVWNGDGWSASGAVIVREPDAGSGGGAEDDPAWSAMLRGGFFVDRKTELVARVEVGDARRSTGLRDELMLLTAGANWYLAGDQLRLQADVGYAFDGPGPAWNTGGTGWQRASDDGQIVLRTQFVLHF